MSRFPRESCRTITSLPSFAHGPKVESRSKRSLELQAGFQFFVPFEIRIERVANRQLEQYFSNNGLLLAIQSGFRRSHSTETAVLKVYNDTDIGDVTVYCCSTTRLRSIRWTTVFHILSILEKSFGFTGLYDHSDVFKSSRPYKSSAVIVFFGLPQDTILGPLFYIVYTADIEIIIEKHGVNDASLCRWHHADVRSLAFN